MRQDKIDILERALAREKAARKQAEFILEKKAIELYEANKRLEKSYNELEIIHTKKDSQLQGVFESIVDAYLIMDLNGNILKMNDAALALLGFKNDKVDFNLMKMVNVEDYHYVNENFNKLLENSFLKDFEIKISTVSGELKHVHINASIIYDGKKPIAAQGIIRDITSLKENNFVAEVINDITQSILGRLDIIDVSVILTKKIADYLETDDCVIYKVNHLEKKVEQIFAIGDKIDESGEIINRLKFNIGEGIVGTVAKTGVSEIIFDVSKDTRYITDIASNLSELTVPIIVNNKVIAVIDSEHPKKNHFTYSHLKTIEKIAKIISLKIKNAIVLADAEEDKKKLLKSEERLRTLISNFKSGILLEDEKRKVILTNDKFCKIFGINLEPDSLIGFDCKNAAEQSKSFVKDPNSFIDRINNILLSRKPVLNEEILMQNGSIYERDYIPLFKNNENYGHLWNYRDVTLKKKYNSEIELQKQKYSSIIANMNLGLLEVDNKDEILFCNHSFLEMSGYREEELIGKKASEIFLDKDSKKILKHQTLKRLDGYSSSYEINIKNKNNEVRTWLISGAPNYDINGKLMGSIGIHLDITDNKKLQIEKDKLLEELKNRNEELTEYAHIVSHDLKSPLRNISALTNWIKSDNIKNLNKESLDYFNHLESTVERMEDLISGILKFSAINSDFVQSEVLDLNLEIEKLIATLHYNSNISVKIVNNLPTIKTNKIRTLQIFQNLLQNAINHIDKEQGLVELGYELTNNSHVFFVKDNGIGIDEKYQNKIFKIFYTTRNNPNSTGIGLAIVKKIIDFYGGKLWLESKIGEGSIFYFSIPNN